MAHLARVSLMGALPSGEKWSVNPVFAFATPLALSTDECLQAATAINGVTVPTTLRAINPAVVTMTGCRFEARHVNGELESVAEHIRTTPITGSSSGAHPPQTSIVLSLRSSDSTARGKGRLYWPAMGMTMNNISLRFEPTAVTTFVNDMNTYLNGIRTAIRGVGGMSTAVLAVWSRAELDTKVVLQLRAGDVPDIQRRRRDKFVESYTSATVAAG